jgi:Ran GTPase-activating protein (RanGAP) involved in mRNA processing and transport
MGCGGSKDVLEPVGIDLDVDAEQQQAAEGAAAAQAAKEAIAEKEDEEVAAAQTAKEAVAIKAVEEAAAAKAAREAAATKAAREAAAAKAAEEAVAAKAAEEAVAAKAAEEAATAKGVAAADAPKEAAAAVLVVEKVDAADGLPPAETHGAPAVIKLDGLLSEAVAGGDLVLVRSAWLLEQPDNHRIEKLQLLLELDARARGARSDPPASHASPLLSPREAGALIQKGMSSASVVLRRGLGGESRPERTLSALAHLMSSLVCLDLSCNQLDAQEAKLLGESLCANGPLASLVLSNNQICGLDADGQGAYTSEGIDALVDAFSLHSSLTSVALLGNHLGGGALTELLKLKHEKPALVTLCGLSAGQATADYRGWGLGTQDAELLARELALARSLTSLEAAGNAFGSRGWSAIFEALRDSPQNQISRWNLSGQGIDSKLAEAFAAYVTVSSSLTSLDISANAIGPAGAKEIVGALCVCCSITDLNLAKNNICGVDPHGRGTYATYGIQTVAGALRALGSLTSLNLQGNLIGLYGARAIGEALHVNRSLTLLSLGQNGLGDEGASILARALKGSKVSKLATLNLDSYSSGSKRIGPAGARALAEYISGSGSLTSLNLQLNAIGPEGASAIADALRANGTLTLLQLQGNNNLGDEGRDAVRSAASEHGPGFRLEL